MGESWLVLSVLLAAYAQSAYEFRVVWLHQRREFLGISDFMARFSSQALGARLTYAVMLLVGTIGTTVWIVAADVRIIWSFPGCALAVIHGFSVASMCMLLYAGLARGPVAIVAPIVAAHPAFVLIVDVALGLRPGAFQWIAMATVVFGGILIAHSVEAHTQSAADKGAELRKTIVIALFACAAYVVLIVTGQAASPLIGDIETLWIGRSAGLLLVGLLLALRRKRISVPPAWLPFIALQGVLDTLGYAAFLAGSRTSDPHVTMVVASTFSVFTVLLARFVLKEAISSTQWFAIAMISTGAAILSGVH